jgi:hypothetical protein
MPLFFLALALGGATAQTPITSLPKPTDSTQDVPTPNAQPEQSPVYMPDSSVHPITSLPKPPGAATNTGTTEGVLATQPAPAINPTPAPPEPPAASTPTVVDTTPPVNAPLPAKGPVYAQPGTSSSVVQPVAAPPVAAPPAPTPTLDAPLRASSSPEQPRIVKKAPAPVHAFSTFAIQFKVGFAGIGFDAAVPLSQHFDLRGGGSIFSYNGSYDDSGDDITGAAQFRTGEFYLDYYPFSHGPLRLSAGVVINGNYLNATTLVKGGQEFDLNNDTYYSSATDPVHGTATFNFGRKAAPSFTLGFGSMIPRTGKHVSFPFEAGFMYIGPPTLGLTLMGTVCDTSTPPNCEKIDNDPVAQASLQQEVNSINADIHFLRFYPILSQGVSIKF